MRVAKLRAAGCGPQIQDCIAGCGLQVTDCGLRVAGHTQIAGCGPQAAGCGPRSDCGLRATDCGLLTNVLRAAGHMLWIASNIAGC